MGMKCPLCDCPVIKMPWLFTNRRNDKALCLELKIWQCQFCKDFDEDSKAFAFIDSGIDKENNTLMKLVWEKVYEEPMPEVGRSKSR